jgi:alpha-L-fucosidase
MDRVPSWFNTSRGADKEGPLAGVPYDGADPANESLYGPPNDEDPEWPYLPRNAPQSWRDHWFLRNRDLIDNYQPDLLYFDGGIPYVEQGLELVAHFYNESMRRHGGNLEAVLNIKKTKVSGAYREGMCVQDLERSKLEGIKAEPWQTDTSIGTWFWRPDGSYESSKSIIQMLADIVSKNGNLLLNIPLMPDGRLDEAAASILSEMAAWMETAGEAIHGTRPWTVYGEGPTKVFEEYSEEIKERYTPEDIRFTTRGDTLYAIGMEWPEAGEVVITSLASGRAGAVRTATLLGDGTPLACSQTPAGLRVGLPGDKSREGAYVLKIEWEG